MPQSSASGGLAFLNVFGDPAINYFQPAFVYYDNLGNGIPDLVAEAAAHEAGHGFGLNHDGQYGQEYYSGFYAKDWSWGPIMGSPYGREVTQWSKGDYPGATNKEDDDAILARHLGSVVDEGEWTITSRRGFQQFNGLIGRAGDVDDWVFPKTEEGQPFLMVDNDPDNRASMGRNLDVKVSLFDSNAQMIWSDDHAGPRPVLYAGPEWHRLQIEPGTAYEAETGGYGVYGNQGRYRIWFGYQHAFELFGGDASGGPWGKMDGALKMVLL